ncbi:MAG: flagellin [Alphaproteobacteria bacterium]
MALNIISNFAANVAHRNLVRTDNETSASLAKLSSGTRVVSARDDAASLAIGSRLRAEVEGLKQAGVNAGQASSLLQIADGASATVADILVRMKSLAIQAASDQLGATERGILNSEFISLRTEVDRIAADTEFNGIQLTNGSITGAQTGAGTGTTNGFAVLDGVSSITAVGIDTSGGAVATTAANYTAATNTFSFTIGGTAYTGVIDAGALTGGAGANPLSQGTTVTLINAANANDPIKVTLTLNTAFDSATNTGGTADPVVTFTGTSGTTVKFKVGTGTASQDDVSFTINSITTATLGISASLISGADSTNANAAVTALTGAIDSLNQSRSNIGAAQNRLQFASANLSSSLENAEAARSELLDLDVASEITTFTSKQVLLQAGVSMLAQANQIPQNLLRLLQ